MVCYARPAIRMAAIVLVVLLILGRAGAHLFPGHFFGTAALIIAVTAAAGGAAVAAALTFAAFGSIRRRRAVAGGCVHCQFRCQHAMTEQPRRRPVARAGQAEAAPPRWPVARAGQPEAAPPRWPDRPAYRAGPAAPPAGHAERGQRAGSPV
jgi:hypothetical protein